MHDQGRQIEKPCPQEIRAKLDTEPRERHELQRDGSERRRTVVRVVEEEQGQEEPGAAQERRNAKKSPTKYSDCSMK